MFGLVPRGDVVESGDRQGEVEAGLGLVHSPAGGAEERQVAADAELGCGVGAAEGTEAIAVHLNAA